MGGISLVGGSYIALAYGVLPRLWRHYEHHPALGDAPKTTTTVDGIPGDPLNVGFTGTPTELVRALRAAGWQPADPITLRTSVGIVRSVLLNRAAPTAPVSTLLVYGRRQDLAFEQCVGRSARQRHHIRVWQSAIPGRDGRPLWLGAATFDRSVGFSHRTAQITHHIAPDVDGERDALMRDLQQAGQLTLLYQVTGVGATTRGRNGGGDWYYTDGEFTIGVLAPNNAVQTTAPTHLPNPAPVAIKNTIWRRLRRVARRSLRQGPPARGA